MREFSDDTGNAWRVVQVDPTVGGGRVELLPPDLRSGWLVFESRTGRRRLTPVPSGWESLPDQRLNTLCESATPAPQLRLE
jgi:hypothetical protein